MSRCQSVALGLFRGPKGRVSKHKERKETRGALSLSLPKDRSIDLCPKIYCGQRSILVWCSTAYAFLPRPVPYLAASSPGWLTCVCNGVLATTLHACAPHMARVPIQERAACRFVCPCPVNAGGQRPIQTILSLASNVTPVTIK